MLLPEALPHGHARQARARGELYLGNTTRRHATDPPVERVLSVAVLAGDLLEGALAEDGLEDRRQGGIILSLPDPLECGRGRVRLRWLDRALVPSSSRRYGVGSWTWPARPPSPPSAASERAPSNSCADVGWEAWPGDRPRIREIERNRQHERVKGS